MAQEGYTPITVLRSDTVDQVPTTAELTHYGELAVNVADRKIYTRDNNNNIILLDNGDRWRPQVIETSATDFTPTLEQEGSLIYFTSASAVTVNLPLDATTDYPTGYIIHLHQAGAGVVTIVPASGVTANSSVSLVAAAQYAALSLMKTGDNRWQVVGDQA